MLKSRKDGEYDQKMIAAELYTIEAQLFGTVFRLKLTMGDGQRNEFGSLTSCVQIGRCTNLGKEACAIENYAE